MIAEAVLVVWCYFPRSDDRQTPLSHSSRLFLGGIFCGPRELSFPGGSSFCRVESAGSLTVLAQRATAPAPAGRGHLRVAGGRAGRRGLELETELWFRTGELPITIFPSGTE